MNNRYRYIDGGKTCEVFFKDESSFLIDAEDLAKISEISWFKGKRGYPIGHTSRKLKDGHKTIPVHKKILALTESCDVDHISGNKMDNRKSNLRICTHQQNMFNQKMRSTNTSGFYGVSFHSSAGKYEAYIHVNGKKHYLGIYGSLKDAADARDRAAVRFFGKYAKLNRDLEVYAHEV